MEEMVICTFYFHFFTNCLPSWKQFVLVRLLFKVESPSCVWFITQYRNLSYFFLVNTTDSVMLFYKYFTEQQTLIVGIFLFYFFFFTNS